MTRTPWTEKRAIKIYEAALPCDRVTPDDPRRPEITEEMNAVKDAATIEDAMKVIAWWEWESKTELRRTVSHIRRYGN